MNDDWAGAEIIGELSITVADGTVLSARTDVRLAGMWAEHEYGPEAWSAMTFGEQSAATADALRELRRAYNTVA